MSATTQSKKESLSWGLASLLPIVLAVTVLHGPTRSHLRDVFRPDYRTILSQVTGNIMGNKEVVKVLKVRTRDSIFVEIYKLDTTNSKATPTLIEKIALDQTKDGHFNFHGQMTSLALFDLDGDTRAEILIPAFDESLNAHLNVIKYDPLSNTFYKASSSEFDSLSSAAYPLPKAFTYKRMLAYSPF